MKNENIKPQLYIVNCLCIINCQLSIVNFNYYDFYYCSYC